MNVTTPFTPRLAYSVEEAATLIDVSKQTIRKLIRQRAIPFVEVGGRQTRILTADLVAFLQNRRKDIKAEEAA